jgi:phosphatidylserine decarboxylase
MAKKIKDWLPEIEHIKKMSREERDHRQFFVDPARPMFINDSFFFSPADGIIMYSKIIDDPSAKILDTKGASFSLQELLQDKEWNKPCLVVSVFMTQFDAHVNRVPLAGLLKYKKLEPMLTKNLPMLDAERELLKGVIDESVPGFLKKNGKVLNTIYSTVYNFKYYVLQIGDSDIDTIVIFDTDQNVKYQQNQRFGMIRWGSTCDLIVPIDPRFEYEFTQEPMMHVEAGVDTLIKITKKGK